MTDETDLEAVIREFLRDARGVYEEYEGDYMDPDAALWTLEGHLDTLEDALAEHEAHERD